MKASVEARTEFAMQFGRRLRVRRKRASMSAETLAQETGIHRNTLDRWERGAHVPDVYQWGVIDSFLSRREGTR